MIFFSFSDHRNVWYNNNSARPSSHLVFLLFFDLPFRVDLLYLFVYIYIYLYLSSVVSILLFISMVYIHIHIYIYKIWYISYDILHCLLSRYNKKKTLIEKLYRDRFTLLLLRFVESHGAHENGPQASVCGAIRFKSRRRREAGERNPRVFEFRYEVIAKIITLCTCICITIRVYRGE